MKTCSCCGATKPLDQFGKRAGRCRTCLAAYAREWRKKNPTYGADYYAKNRERCIATQKRNYSAEYHAQWRAKNAERDTANKARWYAEHEGYTAQWRAEHPLECQVYGINKTAYARGATGPGLTLDEWRAILLLFGNRCAYCGASGENQTLECDHVIPVSRGGRHGPENIVPACAHCNTSKGARGILCMANVEYVSRAA